MLRSALKKKSVQFSDTGDEFFEIPNHAWTTKLSENTPAYRVPEERSLHSVAPASSISRPNYEDILKRVSIVVRQHIVKCEERLKYATPDTNETGLFYMSKMKLFDEDNYLKPQYCYQFQHSALSHMGGMSYRVKRIETPSSIPEVGEIYAFCYDLFLKAQLSAECSIVCLIYVERLMQMAHVPVLGKTWRPCLLCGLLLASKVWQDLSSWNSEISTIYPQFSLEAINKLEIIFCKEIGWNLYISSSIYAKYYFGLRSLTEKSHFRRNYNAMVINTLEAQHIADRQNIAERSEEVKQTVLNAMTLSRSL